MIKTAILVDGGFYRKRAAYLWGHKSAEQRANELYSYCRAHLEDSPKDKPDEERHLYRVLYYDCMPIKKSLYHPLEKRNIDYGRSDTYKWMETFLEQLKTKRKFALRLGELSDTFAGIGLKPDATRDLCAGKREISDLNERDLSFSLGQQKGVDMKIGLDIASLSYKKLVDQIILIAGDSDFVPAAKLARREGVDFILDPMWASIRPNLFEHIDGLKSQWKKKQN
jgi:uncharacterized LabA/DUF88 family protein